VSSNLAAPIVSLGPIIFLYLIMEYFNPTTPEKINNPSTHDGPGVDGSDKHALRKKNVEQQLEKDSTVLHIWFIIKWCSVAFAALSVLVYLISLLLF